ncbi:DUF3265 domain-containing protein [Vibrio metschnikovii]|nr:DUF3265 domain-containing protein [Vibrio metschnikovii]
MTNASRGTSNAWHFLLCVDFGGYGVMRKLGSRVVSPLSGRYSALEYSESMKWKV